MLDIGDTVQGLHVVRLLHEGSMAVTYEVEREGTQGRLALKLLHIRDPEFQRRLRRTGQAQRSFVHPNIVAVIDTVEIDGAPGVVSRFVDGDTLNEWIARGPHGLPAVLAVARGIAAGLGAAHERGLIHRNLKPQKVIVDADGVPHIHDFMLGKVVGPGPDNAMTQMGMTFGTPQYMAPEQFRGAAAVDERADLFSLGCLLYEMLAGQRAYDGAGLMDIYEKVLASDRVALSDLRADVPPAVVELVGRLLAVDAEARPGSADEVVEALDSEPDLRAARGLAPLGASLDDAVAPDAQAPTRRGGGATLMPAVDDGFEELVLGTTSPAGEPTGPTVAPAVDPAEPGAQVPPPPSLVNADNRAVWMAMLGLLVVGLVIGSVVAVVVMGGR